MRTKEVDTKSWVFLLVHRVYNSRGSALTCSGIHHQEDHTPRTMWASLWSGPVPNGQSSPSPAIKESRAAHRLDGRDRTNGVAPSSGEVCSNIDTINSKTAAKTISRILRGVVVGEARSGKTCLIRRLRGEDPFQQIENNESRFFIEVKIW